MTTIDEIGRRAAAAARADAADITAARVESGLERLRLDDGPTVVSPSRGLGTRRWVAVGASVALVAAAVVALFINLNEGKSNRVVPGSAPSTAVVTTNLPDTTEASETTQSVTPTPTPVATESIGVRHDALPPAFHAEAFLGITDQTRLPFVAIGDSRIVVIDAHASTATLIDPFSPTESPQPVLLQVSVTGHVAAGPGDVLYAVVQGPFAEMSLDAIALSGDRVGQVIGSAPIGSAEFAEAPIGVLGHGPDGIIDRRSGETLLGYVDVTGAPTSIGRPTHAVATISGDVASGDMIIRDPDGHHDWHLTIERDPTSPGSYTGEVPPAPSSHAGAVVWTSVGPPEDPSSDIPTASEPVVAVLAADGSGTWYSLTDGWQVAASDLEGTILTRLNGSTVEFARLDPPQRFDFLDGRAEPRQRVQFAETLPTTLTTAPACALENLDIVPTDDGAMGTVYGGLNLRNRGAQPCEVSGVPDIAFLDDAGNVVSSTDPALLGQTADPIVLEPTSWAIARLGPIGSNVCGGNESSQFRLTTSGGVVQVPFAAGSPVQPDSCSPSGYAPPGPGTLQVEPFARIEANAPVNLPENLQLALDAPPTVRAGEVLRYDVVMTAAGDPVVISDFDCPIYEESLGAAVAHHLLDCNGSDGILIAPGESVVFHIELPIPADTTLGQSTLSWVPLEPAGTEVTATVTIVA